MADEPKNRIPPPAEVPADQSFTPGPDPGPDAHPPEDEFWQNVMYESNEYKTEHCRASAQWLANNLNCAVLLHYYTLPGFQHTGPTMMAALIPADEGLVEAPPASVRKEPQDQSWRRKSSE
jgi:hypothetical protein